MYKIINTFNENKKISGSLKYLTSTLSLLKYGHKNKFTWSSRTIDIILAKSNEPLECLKYCHDNGCPFAEDTCNNAAQNGQV